MQFIQPQAFHIAQTEIDRTGMDAYLSAVGAPGWRTDAPTGGEELIEVLGRMCYRSFLPGLNPNVTKVREGNASYLGNVSHQRHGSLFEHSTDTFVLFNVSRVCTHQLVRHRAGCSWAQESGHYVRVDGIKSWFPAWLESHPRRTELFDLYKTTYEDLEEKQRKLAAILDVDNLPFGDKKKATTAMRRLVPDGIATAIGMTCNQRAWRWICQLRTERSNDDEIRLIMSDVFRQQMARYPNLYADAKVEIIDGIEEVHFGDEKI